MCYLRSLLKEVYLRQKRIKKGKLLLTRIVDLEFERKCLDRYLQVITYQTHQLEKGTTLEADQELLSGETELAKEVNLTSEQKFCVVYRSERKKILRSQKELVSFLLNVLEESYQLKSLKSVGAPKHEIDLLFKKIYLHPMESEKIYINSDGDFIDAEEEYWYQYRRLHMRSYLQQIFQIQTDEE